MKKYYYSGGALALGILGFFVRRWQLDTCFDASRLPVPGPATGLLIGLTMAEAALFLALALPLHGKKDWPGAFGPAPCHWIKLAAICYLLAGAAFFINQTMVQAPSAVFQIANILLPIMLAGGIFLAAVGLWFLSRGGKTKPLAAMAPGFCSCFWLVNAFHTHANDPVVLGFIWTLLAIVASVLAWYETAGFSLGKGHSQPALFWSLMTVALCLTALADGDAWYIRLLLAAQVLSFTVQSARLVDRMEAGRPEPEGEPPQETAE